MRSDGGFEDREGHQAPFTLPIANCQLPIANLARSATNLLDECEVLFCFFDRLDDIVEVRPIAGVEFGMEQFAIGANLESAAARGNQRERRDALAELKNFGRQTDGLRRVVSNDAVFDGYVGFHRLAPFQHEIIDAFPNGQAL